MVAEFKKLNPNVPTDPREQLRGAILAVFRSWNNDRAIRYRSYNGIPDEWGTAVSVQVLYYAMFCCVFMCVALPPSLCLGAQKQQDAGDVLIGFLSCRCSTLGPEEDECCV